jgi:hypothetical protein
MPTDAGDLEQILSRVGKLERTNAQLKRALAMAALVGALILFMGQAKAPAPVHNPGGATPKVISAETVRAGKVEIVNSNGEVLATFSALSDTLPALFMHSYGGDAVWLSPDFGLWLGDDLKLDSNGRLDVNNPARARLMGSSFGSSLNLKDGHNSIYLSVSDSSGSKFFNSAYLGVNASDALVTVGRDSEAHTTIGATDLKTVATGASYRTTPGSIYTFDSKGLVTWSALDDPGQVALFQTTQMQNDVRDLQRKLDDFKEGVCPILRSMRLSYEAQLRLISACT